MFYSLLIVSLSFSHKLLIIPVWIFMADISSIG
nr:MAG TPA: hypothetical protein [Caudoviricetes sp.]